MNIISILLKKLIRLVANNGDYFPVNIGSRERQVSLLSGIVLLLLGIFGFRKINRPFGIVSTLAAVAMLYRGASGHCIRYQLSGIDTRSEEEKETQNQPYKSEVKKTVMIQKSAQELFNYWRSFQNLPQIIPDLEIVNLIDNNKSEWTTKGPFQQDHNWEVEIISEANPLYLAWKATHRETGFETLNELSFKEFPHNRGTLVTLVNSYPISNKLLEKSIKRLTADPSTQLQTVLKNFRAVMEAGEIIRA